MVVRQYKAHSPIYRSCFLLGYTSELLRILFQLCGGTRQLFGLAPLLLGRSRQLLGPDPLLVFQVPRVGLSKVSLAPGSLDVSLHQVHCLSEFVVLLNEGLHPLY